MPTNKADLGTSLWTSCDVLRGGMDASQYKDCVLFLLFTKCISDKYGHSDDFAPPVSVPACASFSMPQLARRRSRRLAPSRSMEGSLAQVAHAMSLEHVTHG